MEGPRFAATAALIGDPARAQVLAALMSGEARTASELAALAGVGKPTMSVHLEKLRRGRLLAVESQGRHRYFRLADRHVARLLESLMGWAAQHGPVRSLVGPRDPALRRARVCYDHLAGELGVRVFDRLEAAGLLRAGGAKLELAASAPAFFAKLGIELDSLQAARRPLLRPCLDWSERRHHLAGGLGAALLTRLFALGWARRVRGSRAVQFTPRGEAALERAFPAA
jgi:DNA-binding transcriptional ArsR family regulator